VLALIDEEPCAQSAASLVLRLEAEEAQWSTLASAHRNSELEIHKRPLLPGSPPGIPPHGRLLAGIRRRAEVIRNRFVVRTSSLQYQAGVAGRMPAPQSGRAVRRLLANGEAGRLAGCSAIENLKLQIENQKSEIRNHRSPINDHPSQILNRQSTIVNRKSEVFYSL